MDRIEAVLAEIEKDDEAGIERTPQDVVNKIRAALAEGVKIERIQGTVVLADGRMSQFVIHSDPGAGPRSRWNQWGAPIGQLAQTADAVEAISLAVYPHMPQVEEPE